MHELNSYTEGRDRDADGDSSHSFGGTMSTTRPVIAISSTLSCKWVSRYWPCRVQTLSRVASSWLFSPNASATKASSLETGFDFDAIRPDDDVHRTLSYRMRPRSSSA